LTTSIVNNIHDIVKSEMDEFTDKVGYHMSKW